jgi:diguanylate cyclase (GGDEF)-like protein/PAS domain S-box-containing protein
VDEECYGALSFARAKPRLASFSMADEDFVNLMGQWIGNRLEQHIAEDALAEEKNLLLTLVDNLPDHIFVKDKDHRYVINNQAHLRFLGLSSQDQAVGRTDFDFFPEERVARIHALEARILETGESVMNQEQHTVDSSGNKRWWLTTKVPLYKNQRKIAGLVGINYDITVQKQATLQSVQQAQILADTNAELIKTNQQLQAEVMRREQAEKQLKHDAMHDMLTGLPNRAMFQNKLTQALFRTRQSTRYRFAVLYLDLDRFKVINDTMGHAQGDQLLITVARRLESCVRPRDTIARLGGDEFTILLDDIQSLNHVIDVAKLVLSKLTQPVNLNGRIVVSGASVGIVQGLATYLDAEAILRDADMAMYRAKQQGVGRYTVFDLAMHSQTMAQAQLEADLQFALESEQFVVHYQPIVSLLDGQIAGVEALPYWEHPQRGLLPPEQFLELAEEARIITELGEWLLQTACQQLKQWHQAGFSSIRLALNFNPTQLQQAQIEVIQAMLAQTEVLPHFLELEIKESPTLRYDHSGVDGVQALSDIGVRIAIDDFGKGYSSIDRLRRLRLNTIKIPASFMADINTNFSNQTIVKAIIGLAHNLNISVIAEGIESAAQLDFLRDQQCNEVQGTLFSERAPAEKITRLLKHNQTHPFMVGKNIQNPKLRLDILNTPENAPKN